MQVSTTRVFTAAILAAASLCALPAHGSQTRAQGWTDQGEATWYGPRHEGKKTSSGEIFDSRKMTAAHASLPLGTWVRVTVANTGASVVVKVNDREPPHGVRCIDLSRAAAAKLGIVSRGVADVTLAQVSGPDDSSVEVAEAPDDAQPIEATRVSARHGRLHRRHAHR